MEKKKGAHKFRKHLVHRGLLKGDHLCGDTAVVNSAGCVGSSVDNGVLVVTVVVAGVDSVGLVPAASVERAVGSERNIVLGEDVGGEEVARLVGAVSSRVVLVVCCLSLTSSGAQRGIVRVVVEQPHSVVGILAVVEGSIDSSGEVRRGVEVRNSGGTFPDLGVTVRTSDDNVESLAVGILRPAPLALVGSSSLSDRVTVDGALDVGLSGGVGTAVLGLEFGVTLEEDVETKAELLGITEVGAGLGVVDAIVKVLVCKVTNLLGAAKLVGEGLLVTVRSGSTLSQGPQAAASVGVVRICATRCGKRSSTTGLLSTAAADIDLTLLNGTLLLDDCGDDRGGSGGIVGDGSGLGLLDLGAKDSWGGNSQGSVDVDHLGSGGDKAKNRGGSNSVTHLDS